ncbi:MAG: hypothetical protein GF329_00250 [Candidatus Lokiarchaeota archaeon]|nr:hypothetical protein [Candidatus Lokiarchaeota archaeon]
MTEPKKGQKNIKKGIANFVLISILYIGIPFVFIFLAPILIPTFQVGIGLIFGIIIIGISNAVSFFLRGYYPPKTMPNIIGGLALCVFSGLFFMYWLVIGSGIEISTEVYIAQADLGIISQIFVWTLIGTSAAFILELFYYYKKLKDYRIVKITKYGFLVANLIAIILLGILISQMATTRYGSYTEPVNTYTMGSNKYYEVGTYIDLSNRGFLSINNIRVNISIYVEESSYYEKGYYLGSNLTRLPDCYGGKNYYILCKANSILINNSISISSILIKTVFYGSCFGASMIIQSSEISSV